MTFMVEKSLTPSSVKLRLHDVICLTDSFVSLYEFQSNQLRLSKFEENRNQLITSCNSSLGSVYMRRAGPFPQVHLHLVFICQMGWFILQSQDRTAIQWIPTINKLLKETFRVNLFGKFCHKIACLSKTKHQKLVILFHSA